MSYIRLTDKGEINIKYIVPDLEVAKKFKLPDDWSWVEASKYKEQIKANAELVKRKRYKKDREREYQKQGLTTDKMIIALWEKVVENRPESADTIQAKRTEIKTKHPKP